MTRVGLCFCGDERCINLQKRKERSGPKKVVLATAACEKTTWRKGAVHQKQNDAYSAAAVGAAMS